MQALRHAAWKCDNGNRVCRDIDRVQEREGAGVGRGIVDEDREIAVPFAIESRLRDEHRLADQPVAEIVQRDIAGFRIHVGDGVEGRRCRPVQRPTVGQGRDVDVPGGRGVAAVIDPWKFDDGIADALIVDVPGRQIDG